MRKWFLIIVLVGLALSACSSEPSEPRLSIEDAWVRPPVTENGNGAIYFRLVNTGRESAVLNGVSSAAATAELHQSVMKDNGIMGMEPLASVEIPAGEKVAFEQGGMHVMLIGLEQPLTEGEKVSFTLQFEHLGNIQFEAEVRQQ